MTIYQDRVDAENLANQAPEVQKAAKALFDELNNIRQYLYWTINPEEGDGGLYWAQSLIDHAHALVDLGHAYRATLAANPPPKENDDDDS